MEEKKNIDRLFQEKFKDFEAHPSSDVWAGIVAAQKERGSKKVIPIWWKLAGVAAALALLLGLGALLLNDTLTKENTPAVVTDTPKNVQPAELQKTYTLAKPAEKLVSTSPDQRTLKKPNTQSNNQKLENNNLASTSGNTTSETAVVPKEQKFFKPTNPKKLIATNETEKLAKNTSGMVNEPTSSAPTKNLASISDIDPKSVSTAQVEESVIRPEKEAIRELESENMRKKDLVAEAEKIVSAQDEEATAVAQSTTIDRWGAGAIAAPVYYSDFGGSGLDPRFKDNDKSGGVNLSYGVQVSYAVTPRFKVRTGVNNLDLSYNTNDLAFSTNGNTRSELEGVNYSSNGRIVAISDASNQAVLAENGLLPAPAVDISNGAVQQRLNYIEVPLEAIYTLSTKRLGVSITGGVSTLLLNTNEVILLSDKINTSLGTSSSINDLSFTTNIGVGLDYKITDNFIFNVEPAFKYQLNGYDETVGEFKPYFLGLYTGFSFKF